MRTPSNLSIGLTIALAGSAAAQDTVFSVEFDITTNTGVIRAEFFGDFVLGATSLTMVWADACFQIAGDGIAPITFIDYNPAYDTSLGDAVVTNGTTASFVGNSNSFFGTPDPSNPPWVADFSYSGSPSELEFSLFGTNSILLDGPNAPFGIVVLYFGTGLDFTPYTWISEVVIVPTPATLAVASYALIATRRRR